MIKMESNNNIIRSLNELSNEVNDQTPIQQFYSGQTIFVTGGTGFLGKVLIEKLLRCCSDIKRIYVLVRQKKGKNVEERIKDLFNCTVFNTIRDRLPKYSKKVIGISGDCCQLGLGLCESDANILKDEVSIVFHVAATIRFDEQLKEATATNLQSTVSVIDLCKKMKNLKSCIYVSTIYANCFVSSIEEKFYDYNMKYNDLLNLVKLLPKDTINSITLQIISSWPNTYTFTKALTENFIRTENKNLPIGIFRPAIVMPTVNEPVPGWIDNCNGPTGLMVNMATGLIRTLHCDSKVVPNIVPVDLTINALIASAWDVAKQTDRRDQNMLIYNFTSTEEAPISWGKFSTIFLTCSNEYPSDVALWYGTTQLCKNKYLYFLCTFFLHSIPAFLLDTIARGLGRKPKMQKIYQKIHKMSTLLNYFSMNEWNVKNANVQRLWTLLDPRDKEMFHFTMQNFDWKTYCTNYVKGVRIYILKDNLKTLEVSRIKCKKFYWLHQLLKTFLLCVGYWFLWSACFWIYQNWAVK